MTSTKYDYPYPMTGLRPGDELHERLVSYVRACAQDAFKAMSSRHEAWDMMNQKMTCFIPASQYERSMKARDPRAPIAVVMPIIFGRYDSLATQQLISFGSEEALHFYDGVGPEDTIPAALGEKVVSIESAHFGELDAHNTAIRDSLIYGFGAVTPEWITESRTCTKRMPSKVRDLDGAVFGESETEFENTEVTETTFEGSRVRNLQPMYYLPDPNVPIHKPNDGAFVGWVVRENIAAVLEQEFTQPENFFNGRYLMETKESGHSPILNALFSNDKTNSLHRTYTANNEALAYGLDKPIDTVYMYIKIVPEFANLGKGRLPEWWLFALSGDKYIRCARPARFRHGRVPVAVCAPDTDGYASTPMARMEMVYGAQEAIDFRWNAHVALLRLATQLRFLVNEERVNMGDVVNMHRTNFIRVAPLAMSTTFDNVIKQLEVRTQAGEAISEIVSLDSWVQEISGGTNAISGMVKQRGESQTATEFKGVRQAALSRVDRLNLLYSEHLMKPLGRMMLDNDIQFRTQKSWVRLAGRYVEQLRAEYGVRALGDPIAATHFPVMPADLECSFDVVSGDSTARSSDLFDSWQYFFNIIATNPVLAQTFNIVRIFKHLARIGGAKNVDDFINQQPVAGITVPDEVAADAAARGDLVPLDLGSQQGMPPNMGGMGMPNGPGV